MESYSCIVVVNVVRISHNFVIKKKLKTRTKFVHRSDILAENFKECSDVTTTIIVFTPLPKFYVIMLSY